jgi:hypothetical protein
MSTELDLINAMLAATGSAGVSSTIGRHPGLVRSAPILARVNRTVQARGHWFNTDWGLKLTPTVEGEFILPQGTLKADTTVKSEPYVRRGRRMYDPKTHSSEISAASMLVDVVIQLDYEDLPITALDLIRTTAVLELVANTDVDQISLRVRADAQRTANNLFQGERLSQADYSLRDNPQYARILGGTFKGRHLSPNNIGG